MLLLINLPLAPLWARLLRIPRPYLYVGILCFATLGAFAVNLQWFDLAILLVLGLLGLMMRRYGLPVLPLIIGVILGPRAERQLRQTLQLSEGSVSGQWSEQQAPPAPQRLRRHPHRTRPGECVVTVLLAYVPTPQGAAALDTAIAEASLRDEELVVINGSKGDAYDDPRFAQPGEVADIEQRLTGAGVRFDWRQEVGEDVVSAVLEVVTEMTPSLLIIGLRKRSPTGKLFLGSRAQPLLLHAPCPVLPVKAG